MTLALMLATAAVYGWALSRGFTTLEPFDDYRVHNRMAAQMAAEGRLLVPHPVYQVLAIAIGSILPGGGTSAGGFATVLAAQVAAAMLLHRWLGGAVLAAAVMLAAPVNVFTPGPGEGYFGYFPANVLHSPTTVLARPLSLALFIVVAGALGRAAVPRAGRAAALAALLTVLCVLAKPNFVLCLVPALALMSLVDERTRRANGVVLAVALPASALLAWQAWLTFATPALARSEIAVAPFGYLFRQMPDSAWLLAFKLVFSILFPLAVVLADPRGAAGDTGLKLAWAAFAVGVLQAYLLAGDRPAPQRRQLPLGCADRRVRAFRGVGPAAGRTGARTRFRTRSDPLVAAGAAAGRPCRDRDRRPRSLREDRLAVRGVAGRRGGGAVTGREVSRAGVVTAGVFALLAACHFAWIRPTNFLGFDEWMIVWLTSRGIVSQPHAGRPIPLVWNLPALLAPHRFLAHHVLFGTYLALSGVLVFALCRAVAPRVPVVAALAGGFAAVWAPLDYQRLATVHMALYGGVTFATLLALFLFLASVRRTSILLLGAAALAAVSAALSYEGTFALLIVPPLAAAAAWPGFRHRLVWALAWLGVLALAAAPGAASYFQRHGAHVYQAAYALDLDPLRMAGRLLTHHAFDLGPVVSTPIAQVAVVPAALCALAVVVLVLCARVEQAPGPQPASRKLLALLAGAGLGLAALGHLPFITSPGLTTPNRTQFLCAPGTGIFLAASIGLFASLAPDRLRLPVMALASMWIVAVGAGRTATHHQTWDGRTAYPAQVHLLSTLVARAPDVKPNTLFVLIDAPGAWPDTYALDHALRYLYEGRARGHVWRARNLFYPDAFTADGIRREPREDIREPWGESPGFFRYDETIAVRQGRDGTVEILERWPARVAVQPATRSYDPLARVVTGGKEPPARRILR